MIFVVVYQSLKKYKKRRETHPHEFVKEVAKETGTEKNGANAIP